MAGVVVGVEGLGGFGLRVGFGLDGFRGDGDCVSAAGVGVA
ncbi:hypothetical protein [Streptomyces bicolor]|nr:hypothetical protein [Streptomyces bicolor]